MQKVSISELKWMLKASSRERKYFFCGMCIFVKKSWWQTATRYNTM